MTPEKLLADKNGKNKIKSWFSTSNHMILSPRAYYYNEPNSFIDFHNIII